MACKIINFPAHLRRILINNNCSEVSRRTLATAAQTQTTVDQHEVDKHTVLLNEWWNPNGTMKALHSMNELRVPFVRDGLIHEPLEERSLKPLQNKSILDVGCGGGILSEPLARLGAQVTGIDASKELINLAKQHSEVNMAIKDNMPNYLHTTIEEHATNNENRYDGVVASEIIEHVADKELFVKSCLKTLKPEGRIYFTTPNRTPLSNIVGVFLAENIFKIVPQGTHDYTKFIKPNELTFLLERNDCHVEIIYGGFYSVLRNRWCFINSHEFLYFLQACKLR